MSELRFVRIEHVLHVSTVVINRPDKLNALDADVLADLEAAFASVRDRAETRCAVLTGEGRAFVAGADIASMRNMSEAEARDFADRGHRLMASIEALRFPVIAAVNGFALGGGCELALACDFIHASEKAKFGLPEVGLGVIPGFGGTQRLARRVGLGMAREWVFSGRNYDAAEAHRIGLVNRVHAPEALVSEVQQLAQEIAMRGPLAVATAKRVMREGVDVPLSAGNALETDGFVGLFPSADRKEGMAAFVEKRSPIFRGE